MNKISEKDQNILNQLKAKNNADVIKVVESLRNEGNNFLLKETFEVYLVSTEDEIKQSIYNLWSDLQKNDSRPVLEEILLDNRFDSIKKDVLSACWNSKITFKEIDIFIDVILYDNFENTIEAYSVIDNNRDYLLSDNVEKNLLKLKQEFSKVDESKKEFVKTIILDLESI